MRFVVGALALAGMMMSSVGLAAAPRDIVQPPPPPGPAAPAAAPGDLGSAIMSARVNANGSLALGEGVTGATYFGGGAYEVAFGRDVRSCTYVISPGTIERTAIAEPRLGVPQAVFVAIYSPGGFVDTPFSLIVYCGR